MFKATLSVMVVGGLAFGSDPMPDVVPALKVSYEDVLKMVKAGGELKIAVGVPAPAGYVRVDDAADYGVKSGLWRCWKDTDGAKMTPLNAPKPPESKPPLLPYSVFPNVQAFMGRQVCTPTG